MAPQVGLAQLQRALLQLFEAHFAQMDVGLDTLGLDGAPLGGVVASGGEFDGDLVVDRNDRLDGTLAESGAPHDHRPAVVLQSAGDDFGGGGGAFVDQHHQRRALEFVAGLGAKLHSRPLVPPLGVNDQALVEKSIRNRHRRLEHAARVVAQIEHQPFEAPPGFLFQTTKGPQHLLGRGRLKLADSQVTETRLEHPPLHRSGLDHRPGDLEDQGFGRAGPRHRQLDAGAGLAAHQLHRFVEAHALHRLVVDADDQIAGLDAGLLGRGVVDGRNHFDEAVFHAHLDAQAAEFAGGAFL